MTQKIDCPLCHGEGVLEETLPGGRFDARAEQWYPAELQRTCSLCKGTKTVDAPQHENTFNYTSDYQRIKDKRAKRRSETNRVVAHLLGCKVDELEPEKKAA
jgi:hypothetical protein